MKMPDTLSFDGIQAKVWKCHCGAKPTIEEAREALAHFLPRRPRCIHCHRPVGIRVQLDHGRGKRGRGAARTSKSKWTARIGSMTDALELAVMHPDGWIGQGNIIHIACLQKRLPTVDIPSFAFRGHA